MEAARRHAYLGVHLVVSSPPPDCDIGPLHLADLGHEEGQMSAASPVPVTQGTFSQSIIARVLGQGRLLLASEERLLGWWELRKAVPRSLPGSLKKIPIPYPICTLLS